MLVLRRSLLLLSLLAFLGTGALAAERNSLGKLPKPAADSGASTGRVIVKYRSNAAVLSESTSTSTKSIQQAGSSSGPQLAGAMGKRLGLSLSDGRALGARSQVLQTSGMSSQRLAERLASDSDVEWAVVDSRRFATTAPNDPLYADNQSSTTPVAGQWYLRATTSTIKSSIDIETAWAVTQGNSNLVVAVLDTGVVKTHPDLSSKLLSGYDFVSDTSAANDGGGRDSDPSDPGDWITTAEDASGTFEDCGVSNSSWHGTRTASLVGASTNNGVGMAGVAPNVMVLPVRVLGKCGGYDSDIVAAMRWAGGLSVPGVTTNTNPARVINLSLGGTGTCSRLYEEAITELTAANVVVVAAAGNEGLAVGVPANCSGVVAVAGVRHSGTKVGYSNLGSEVVVSAPAGNCVNSTGTCIYPIITAGDSGTTSPVGANYSNGSNYSVGTSFSTPLVAGTVALMLSANSSLTPGEVISLLKSSARTFPSTGADSGVASCQAPSGTAQDSECYCTTSTCGAGLLDAGAAVSAALKQGVPTAVVSSSATLVLAGETVTLSGSGSTAISGRSVASYLWEISSGSGFASFSTAANLSSVSLLAAAEGTVTVKLTVTDSAGQSASQSSSFRVAAGLPSASFTLSSSTPVVGDSVTLNGAASAAQGSASIGSYLWEVIDGSSRAGISGSATGSSATLLTSAAGSVTVRLTVTDSNGYSASNSQTLTVTAASTTSSELTTSATGSTATSSGGGGGGVLSPLWALALLAACGLLRRAGGSARR
jgi:serine protease